MPVSPLRIAVILLIAVLASPGVAGAQEEEAYPIEAIDRPFTLPQGAWQAGLDLDTDQSFDAVGMTVLGDYGVTDDFQLGVGYGLSLYDFDAKGEVFVQGSYYLSLGPVDAMPFAALGYSLAAEGAAPLELGSLFWYTISDMLAVYTVPTLTVTLSEVDSGVVGVDPIRPIFLSLPVTLAVQPMRNVYVELSTELASIEISDAGTQIFGADYVPVYLTALYSPSNQIDIGAGVGWDDIVGDAGAVGLLALARYRGGI